MQWWGNFPIQQNQPLGWSIGERAIVIERFAHEWQIWNLQTEAEDNTPFFQGSWADQERLTDKPSHRCLQQVTADSIKVLPALADRSFVTRPTSSLHILPGEQIRLYVSTPLWLQVLTSNSDSLLADLPFWRPSDSWFGPSTTEGEICYAKFTDAKLDLELLDRKPYRAITPINVFNDYSKPLVIERFNVPVPLLGLFHDDQGQLWTETVTVIRDKEHDSVELELGIDSPDEAINAKRVSEPRVVSEKNLIVRSISSLFL